MVRCCPTGAVQRRLISALDWNPITREQILTGTLDPLSTYSGSKTLAEHAVWEFVAEHPEIDITVREYTVFGLDSTDLQANRQL